jgi:hypothetical protein
MFVPSLSWQNNRFNVEMAQKVAFFAPTSMPLSFAGPAMDG